MKAHPYAPLPVSLIRPPAAVRWSMICIMLWSVVLAGLATGEPGKPKNTSVEEASVGGAATMGQAKPAGTPRPASVTQQMNNEIIDRTLGGERATNAVMRVTIRSKNSDIVNIIRLIARVSGANIVVGPDVKGTVSVELADVPWDEALRLVLNANGYSYTRGKGNIISVVRSDQIDNEPPVSEVIIVNYKTATEIKKVITPMLTKDKGSCEVQEDSNALVIYDAQSKFEKIQNVVRLLDVTTPQIMIEAKFIEVTDDDTDRRGTDWSNLDDWSVLLHDMLYTFDRDVIRSANSEQIGMKNVDINRLPIGGNLPTGRAQSWNVTESEKTSYQLTPDQFKLGLSMLMNDARAKLISNPKLQTMDGMAATIRVAEMRYKPSFTFNKDTGTYDINALIEIPVGIILEVTPRKNPRGEVTLDLKPEVSQLAGEQMMQNTAIPIVNTRQLKTRVTVPSRSTIAVGGLIRDDFVYKERQLPFLGDLPYVGPACFKWRSKEKASVNLIIFITPTVVDEKFEVNGRWDRQVNQMHLTPDGEWIDRMANAPSNDIIRLREQMLISGITNTFDDAASR